MSLSCETSHAAHPTVYVVQTLLRWRESRYVTFPYHPPPYFRKGPLLRAITIYSIYHYHYAPISPQEPLYIPPYQTPAVPHANPLYVRAYPLFSNVSLFQASFRLLSAPSGSSRHLGRWSLLLSALLYGVISQQGSCVATLISTLVDHT